MIIQEVAHELQIIKKLAKVQKECFQEEMETKLSLYDMLWHSI